jgi:hypothetical protein
MRAFATGITGSQARLPKDHSTSTAQVNLIFLSVSHGPAIVDRSLEWPTQQDTRRTNISWRRRLRSSFHVVLDAFAMSLYRIDKPLFVVYMPDSLPDPQRFTDLWNEFAVKAGLQGIYFVGIVDRPWSETPGFDGYTYHLPGTFLKTLPKRKLDRLVKTLRGRSLDKYLSNHSRSPLMADYSSLILGALSRFNLVPDITLRCCQTGTVPRDTDGTGLSCGTVRPSSFVFISAKQLMSCNHVSVIID